MANYQYDLVIIGGGSGGLTAARLATALGSRVALIDKERLGGDCLNYGCVPSKTLIHAARLRREARTVASFLTPVDGAAVTAYNVDMGKIAAHIQETISRVRDGEKVYTTGVDIKFGEATFQSPHELKLNDNIITANSFIIATGSSPALPETPGLVETGYLTNEQVFDLTDLPEKLAILGGGPIGCEFAQAFARLGSKVTIIQRSSRLLPKEDNDISIAVQELLSGEGVDLKLNTQLKSVKRSEKGKVLTISGPAGEEEIEVAEILVAVGRQPNVEGLNLKGIGLKYGDRGIKVDDHLQTSIDSIYAIGDVIGGYLFTHVAAYQAGIAAPNTMVPRLLRKKVDYRVVPWVTFTDPEAARAGLTEEEARKENKDIRVVRFPWHEIDRAQTDDATMGFIKLILEPKGDRIIGVHLFGAHAGELLAEVALAMQNKLTIGDILNTIHAYPTYATGFQQTVFEAFLTSPSLEKKKQLLRFIN